MSAPKRKSSGVTSRARRASSNERLLVRATELIAEAGDAQRTLEGLAQLVVPRIGDNCVIDVVDDEGELQREAEAAADPKKRRVLEALRRFPAHRHRDTSPAYRALRTGQVVHIERFDEAALERLSADEEYKDLVRRIGARSAVSVPITARGRILGVLTFGMAESGRTHAPEDIEFAERLARHAGLALDNSRLFQSERTARRQAEGTAVRLARIGRLTAALSEAVTPHQVAEAVLRHAVPALEVNAGVVSLFEPEEGMLRLLAAEGHPSATWEMYERIPVDRPIPMAEAVRTRQPVFVEDWAEWRARYPDAPRTRPASQSVMALPLIVHGRVLGALGLSRDEPLHLGEADRTLVSTIADQCAQALDRAQLFAAEQTAREEAERAHARLLLLADAQQQFVEASDDYEQVLQTVARELSEVIGDSCWVRLLSPDHQWLETPLVHHADPELARSLQTIVQSMPQRADTGLSGEVLRSGKPILIPRMQPEELKQRIAPEYRAYVDRYPLYSIMGAVLRGRGQVFGLLQMARHSPGRPYDEDDLILLDQLAQRAGMAYSKARLLAGERRARDEAEQALRTRDEFLAVVSHDLRTPLNTVTMAATLLGEELREGTDAHRQVQAIRRAVTSMDHLIADLVELARLEQGGLQLERQPHPVRELVEEVVELLRPQAEERRQKLEVAWPPGEVRAVCDRRRIAQVLTNLLANAIRFTPDGGTATVAARVVEREVELTVRDSGPGISEASQKRIFERYWTGSSDGRKGLGLGLSIVKGLLEAHDAHVQVASAEGEGAAFSFRLPLDK
ncbi:MAG: GAF domain-containing protein [Myxococcota bacterium]